MIRLTLLVFTLFFSSSLLADRFTDAGCSDIIGALRVKEADCPLAFSHNSSYLFIKHSWHQGAYGDCKYRYCPNPDALKADGTFDDLCSQSPTSCAFNSSPYYPEPPPECPTGWGGTGCDVWQGCPSGYTRYGNGCIEDVIPENSNNCYLTSNSTMICDDDPDYETDNCNTYSPDYVFHHNGEPVCSGQNEPNPNDCSSYGYMVKDGKMFSYCDNRESVPEDDPHKRCEKGEAYINGACSYVPKVDANEKSYREDYEDGSYSEVKEVEEIQYNADGTQTVSRYKEVQKYNSDGTKDGAPLFTESSQEKKQSNSAVANADCNRPPSCNGDAIQCATLIQIHHVMCQTKDINEKLSDDDSGSSSVSGGANCESAPVCSGDAVQCAILDQLHQVKCKDHSDIDGDGDGGESSLASEQQAVLGSINDQLSSFDSEAEAEIAAAGGRQSVDLVVDFSDLAPDYEPDAGDCPEDLVLNLDLFGEFVVPTSNYCSDLKIVGTLVRTSAAYYCFLMVFGFLRDV